MQEYISKDGNTRVVNHFTPHPNWPQHPTWSETFEKGADGKWQDPMVMLGLAEIPVLWDQPMKRFHYPEATFFIHSPLQDSEVYEHLKQDLPGLLEMMPTMKTTMETKTWNIYKSPEAAKTNRYSMVIARSSSLSEEEVEHADDNCGMAGDCYTVLEYIGYESDSANWSPDYADHSAADAFSDAEIAFIFELIQRLHIGEDTPTPKYSFKLKNRSRGESEVGKFEDLTFTVYKDSEEPGKVVEIGVAYARMESDALEEVCLNAAGKTAEWVLHEWHRDFSVFLSDNFDVLHYYID